MCHVGSPLRVLGKSLQPSLDIEGDLIPQASCVTSGRCLTIDVTLKPDVKPLEACLFPLVECGDSYARIGGQVKKTERFGGVRSLSLSSSGPGSSSSVWLGLVWLVSIGAQKS
jgi:hypothetical protein